MEIVNYKTTTTQPDGSEHVDLWAEHDAAEAFAKSMAPWPVKVEEQWLTVEIGTIVTVRSPGNGREFTGAVEAMEARPIRVFLPTGYPDNSWFRPAQLLRVEDPAETRGHAWLPAVQGIRTCRRLNCYKEWMPGKAEPLGCKGTGSE